MQRRNASIHHRPRVHGGHRRRAQRAGTHDAGRFQLPAHRRAVEVRVRRRQANSLQYGSMKRDWRSGTSCWLPSRPPAGRRSRPGRRSAARGSRGRRQARPMGRDVPRRHGVPGRDLIRLRSDRGDAVGGIVAAPRFGAQPERLGDAPDLRRRVGHVEGRPGALTRVDDGRHTKGARRADHVQKRVDDGIRPALHVPHAAERAVHVDDGAAGHPHLPQRSDDVLERDQRPVRSPAFPHLPVRWRA